MATLIIFRHGQSVWNLENKFTGWVDVELSEKGIQEAKNAGEKLKPFKFDLAYASALKRAQNTLNLALEVSNQSHVPTTFNEALNERMYGELQGVNKAEMAKKYGAEQVHIWRRSFDVPPPNGESLQMTAARSIPYFEESIVPHLKEGKNIFIAAHGNSLRSIIMELDQLTPQEVVNLELATGHPIIYEYRQGQYFKQL